ncbi:RagB/SusD family nutrient uptake outer membrane protein [Marinifilum sp.]|uniref:RagB/SusD family nutrient uptake outer membrane protein n=1 Tax=Marinifilum sp. TaxID=2033137 RepID=UPI003BAA2B83
MKKMKFIYILILGLSFTACSDWLDVKPETEVDLVDQVSTPRGLVEMLNGVYVKMVSPELYGHHLVYGAIADLAQNYYTRQDWNQRPFIHYTYESTQGKTIKDNIWHGMYNAIANTNAIIDNIDAIKEKMPTEDYNLIKGEAYAIRAYLHFDLIRLFGDAYEDAGESPQIPYANKFDRVRFKHLSAEKVYTYILDDISEAEKLLVESDPVVTGSAYDGDFFELEDRLRHLNYYAVIALKARVHLTMGDTQTASNLAQQVIDEYTWNWTVVEDLTHYEVQLGKKTLFEPELVCALNVNKLNTYYNSYFGDEEEVSYNAGIADVEFSSSLFEASGFGANDWRYLYLWHKNEQGYFNVPSKYDQISTKAGVNVREPKIQSVPLVRITEMMLIVAEHELKDNYAEAISIIQTIQDKRDYQIADPDLLTVSDAGTMLEKEFRKETYIEGQLFYRYKRLGLESIPAMNDVGTITLPEGAYKLPLPESEREYGNIDN